MKRVLIVDDSMFMRNAIRNILKTDSKYAVCGEAKDGREAVQKFRELMPDIVTMDVTMDEMSGLDALRDIIGINKNAKVLMVSALGQESIIKDALVIGAKDFIVKPFKEETVLNAFKKL